MNPKQYSSVFGSEKSHTSLLPIWWTTDGRLSGVKYFHVRIQPEKLLFSGNPFWEYNKYEVFNLAVYRRNHSDKRLEIEESDIPYETDIKHHGYSRLRGKFEANDICSDE